MTNNSITRSRIVFSYITTTSINQDLPACKLIVLIHHGRSDKSPITGKRITNIIDYLTYEVWQYQVRGLYEEHKFLYTLLLTLKICLQSNRIKPNEFMTFIKGEENGACGLKGEERSIQAKR